MSAWVDGSMAREPCEGFDRFPPEPNTDNERLPEEFRRFLGLLGKSAGRLLGWSAMPVPGYLGTGSFRERLGSFRERPGASEKPPGVWEASWSFRKPPGASGGVWEASGSFREHLGSLWEPAAASGMVLGPSGSVWEACGSFRERLGSLRERLGSLREPPKAFGKPLGASGSVWEASGRLRERLGSLREAPGGAGSTKILFWRASGKPLPARRCRPEWPDPPILEPTEVHVLMIWLIEH